MEDWTDWTAMAEGSLSKSFKQNEGGEQETRGEENCGRREEEARREGGEMIERRDGGKIAYSHARNHRRSSSLPPLILFDLFLTLSLSHKYNLPSRRSHRWRNTSRAWTWLTRAREDQTFVWKWTSSPQSLDLGQVTFSQRRRNTEFRTFIQIPRICFLLIPQSRAPTCLTIRHLACE